MPWLVIAVVAIGVATAAYYLKKKACSSSDDFDDIEEADGMKTRIRHGNL